MVLKTGLAAQFGVATESTHGTYVAPTRFFEFNSESLSMEVERLESAGLRANTRIQRSDRWVAGSKTVGGDVEIDIVDSAIGILLDHMLGGTVATVDVGLVTSAYGHTWTGPGDLPAGLTVQVGRPDLAGVVHPFSYLGCKVASWSISADVGEIGNLTMSLAGQDETTAQALVAATYPSNKLMTFVEATLTIAAASRNVRSVELTGDNGLVVDRHVIGSQKRLVPVEGSMREYGGTIDSEFLTLTDYNRFVNGTEAELIVTFLGATDIESGFPPRLRVTENVRFDGETPQVGGPEEIPQNLAFKVVTDSGGDNIKVEYQTSDAAP